MKTGVQTYSSWHTSTQRQEDRHEPYTGILPSSGMPLLCAYAIRTRQTKRGLLNRYRCQARTGAALVPAGQPFEPTVLHPPWRLFTSPAVNVERHANPDQHWGRKTANLGPHPAFLLESTQTHPNDIRGCAGRDASVPGRWPRSSPWQSPTPSQGSHMTRPPGPEPDRIRVVALALLPPAPRRRERGLASSAQPYLRRLSTGLFAQSLEQNQPQEPRIVNKVAAP